MPAGNNGGSEASAEPSDDELRSGYGEDVAREVADIRAKRKAALAAPTSFAAAEAFGDALFSGLKKNYIQIGGIDWRQYLRDAVAVLGTATEHAPAGATNAADALAKRGAFQYAMDDLAGGEQSVRKGFAKAHTFMTGVSMAYVEREAGNADVAKTLCETTRNMAKSDDEVYALLEECVQLVQGEPREQVLTWASAADWELYDRRVREKMERNLARREAEAERRLAAPPSAPSPDRPEAATPAAAKQGPEYASFTLRSSCRRPVKLFYGETPKFGSGRTDSMSGNSSRNERMREGEMIWILDDSGNGVSSFSASARVREVVINDSCSGFQAR